MSGPRGAGMGRAAGRGGDAAGHDRREIQAERLAGKSLVQIAAEQESRVSEDKLISTIIDAKKADLAALVDDGKLTQAQMELMVEHMQTQVKTMVERTTVGPMQGRGRAWARCNPVWAEGEHGMGQGFRGGRGANQ